MSATPRAHLESLLRARKLDGTLTTSSADAAREDAAAPSGLPALDEALGGGLRRGHLSNIVGARSSGRTTLLCRICAAAAARGEVVAIVDASDRFDPASAAAAGVDLSRVLWIRLATPSTATSVKAMNLVLQAGNFGVVALDLGDLRSAALREVPMITWMRLARVIEGSQTVALLVSGEHLARSPGGVTIALDDGDRVWSGRGDRSRLLRGLDVRPRVRTARDGGRLHAPPLAGARRPAAAGGGGPA